MDNKKQFTHKTFDELWNDPAYLSEDEKAIIEFEVMLIEKLVKAREEMCLTQHALAEKAGIKQSALARLETMRATPQIDTLIKVLKPLGYRLDIVKDESIT